MARLYDRVINASDDLTEAENLQEFSMGELILMQSILMMACTDGYARLAMANNRMKAGDLGASRDIAMVEAHADLLDKKLRLVTEALNGRLTVKVHAKLPDDPPTDQ